MNCKLVGQFVQHLEVTLDPGEHFYSERGAVIYIEDGIQMDSTFNGSGLGRILGAKLSGESLFILHVYNGSPMPKKVVFGSKFGLVPVKMNGETMVCHRGAYVASNNKMDVTTKLSITGFTGGMGLLLQKITGHGTVFLDTIGTPITINLEPGRTIEVDEDHIIALHRISDAQMQANWSLRNLFGGEGVSMLKITGPGTGYLSPGKPSAMFPPVG